MKLVAEIKLEKIYKFVYFMRNIFVLFSPGSGGNHVANLLSTSKNFESRINKDRFKTHNETNAHYSYHRNLQLKTIESIDKSKNNVLCGHWLEYYHLILKNKLHDISGRQIFILETPNKNELALHRFVDFNHLNDFQLKEQRALYSIEIIRNCFFENDFWVFPSDLIFVPKLDKFYEYVEKQMGLELDIEFCDEMHQKWYSSINDWLK